MEKRRKNFFLKKKNLPKNFFLWLFGRGRREKEKTGERRRWIRLKRRGDF